MGRFFVDSRLASFFEWGSWILLVIFSERSPYCFLLNSRFSSSTPKPIAMHTVSLAFTYPNQTVRKVNSLSLIFLHLLMARFEFSIPFDALSSWSNPMDVSTTTSRNPTRSLDCILEENASLTLLCLINSKALPFPQTSEPINLNIHTPPLYKATNHSQCKTTIFESLPITVFSGKGYLLMWSSWDFLIIRSFYPWEKVVRKYLALRFCYARGWLMTRVMV